MDRDILQFMDDKLGQGKSCALIIVQQKAGSAPGEEGTLMAVCEDQTTSGTCGGGTIEKVLTGRVLEGMSTAINFSFNYNLADDLGMACGGTSAGYVRYFTAGTELVIFGAGHCSQALVRLLQHMRFHVTVVDDRAEFAQEEVFAGVRFLALPPAQAVKEIKFSANLYIVVATWGHHLDAVAYSACLGREYAFLGGLGSAKKAASVKETLLNQGHSQSEIAGLHLPIGVDLADGTPEEIAVSILAELLLVKNNKELKLKNNAAQDPTNSPTLA